MQLVEHPTYICQDMVQMSVGVYYLYGLFDQIRHHISYRGRELEYLNIILNLPITIGISKYCGQF